MLLASHQRRFGLRVVAPVAVLLYLSDLHVLPVELEPSLDMADRVLDLLVEDLLLLVQRQALSERLVVVVPLEFACGVVQVMIQVSIMHFLCAGVLCISYVIDLRKQLHLWVGGAVHKRRGVISIVPMILLWPHAPLA